jgi:hypothetical protein
VSLATSTNGTVSTTFSTSITLTGKRANVYIPGFLKQKLDIDFIILNELTSGGNGILFRGKDIRKSTQLERRTPDIAVKRFSNYVEDEFRFEISLM